MKKTKFMTRIFSAIENDEKEVLEQLDKDIDIAKEDGVCDTDQYAITASDDEIVLHDKVNDEDTKIVEEENGDTTFAAVDKTFADNPEVERLQKRLDQLKDDLSKKKASLDELYADEDEGGISTHADQVENEIQHIKDEIDKVKEQIKKAKEKKFSEELSLVKEVDLSDKNFANDKGPFHVGNLFEDETTISWYKNTFPTKDKAQKFIESEKSKLTKKGNLPTFYIKSDDEYKKYEKDHKGQDRYGNSFSEMPDEELDKTVEFSSVKTSRVKNFSLESLKSFAKGGWKDGKLYIKMGDSDVALDLKNKVAIILDENLSCPIDPKKSVIDNLTTVEKFMKENDLKVFSDEKDYYCVEESGPNDHRSWKVLKSGSFREDIQKANGLGVKGPFTHEEAEDKCNELNKSFSDANPTPEQEGVIDYLKGWVEEHPGEAKYLVELGAKWGPDNLLEGLNHDAEGDKEMCNKFSKFSPAVAKMFSKK